MNYRTYLQCLAVMGLDSSVGEDDLKMAFRRLAMKHHPDRNQSDDAYDDSRFKAIKSAYEYVSDAHNRAEFVRVHQRQTTRQQCRGFANSAGVAFKVVKITLEDAYNGAAIRVEPHVSLCIAKGTRSGTKLHVNGQFYRIDIATHHKFKRSEDDLLVDVTISAIEAMIGTELVITKLDGTSVTVLVPQGVQHGQVVCMDGHGMPNPELPKVGDMLVRISVIITRGLSDQHLRLLRQLDHRHTITI